MGSIGNGIALILILIVAISGLSLLMVESAFAQSIPKLSVPEFSLSYVDHSYYEPVTYTNYTDPYTGQQKTKSSGGYPVENKSIDVTIRNQPFISTSIDGNTTKLYYEIRWKGHFENWTDYAFSDVNYNYNGNNYYYDINYAVQATNSDYTVISYSPSFIGNIQEGGQVDFQVKAQVGYTFLYYGGHIQAIGTDYHYVTQRDWSNAQTITIPASSSSASPTTVPEFPSTILIITFLVAATLLATIVIRRRKNKGFRQQSFFQLHHEKLLN